MGQVGNIMGHVGNLIGQVGNPLEQAGNPMGEDGTLMGLIFKRGLRIFIWSSLLTTNVETKGKCFPNKPPGCKVYHLHCGHK